MIKCLAVCKRLPQGHAAEFTPGTLRRYRKLANPIFSVLICVASELCALSSNLCALSLFLCIGACCAIVGYNVCLLDMLSTC